MVRIGLHDGCELFRRQLSRQRQYNRNQRDGNDHHGSPLPSVGNEYCVREN